MALCRVWYGADEKIFVSHVDYKRKPPVQTAQEFFDAEMTKILLKNPTKYRSLDFEDLDDSTLPDCCIMNTADRLAGKREKLRGNKAAGLRIDNSVRVRQDVENELDAELDSDSPDMKKVAKYERKLRKHDYSTRF